jgi:ribonuclease P protein component
LSAQWVLKRGFDRVFAARRSVTSGPLAVRWTHAEDGRLRIGISVARRTGNAVQRNKVKRRVRAVVRELLPRLTVPVAVVVVARQGAAQLDYQAFRRILQELLTRAGIMSGEGRDGAGRPDDAGAGGGS